MSYDIFCYRSTLGRPNKEEAGIVIEANTRPGKDKSNIKTKLAIVKALTTFNSKLEVFDFDDREIAKLVELNPTAAREKLDHIEIHMPSGEEAVQMTVFDDHVFITVPTHWYKRNNAQKLFRDIKSYIRIIRDTAGYFVLDPQTGLAFDPLENELGGLKKYLSIGEY